MNSQKTLNLHPTLRRIYEIPAVKSVAKLVPPEVRQKFYKPFSRKESYKIQLSEIDKIKVLQRLQPDLTRLETEYHIDVQGKWGLPITKSANLI